VKVAFLGNNEAFGGSSIDSYPDNGSFEYYFDGGTQGRPTPVVNNQEGVITSPQNHEPAPADNTSNGNNETTTNGGGGSFSWLLLLPGLILVRRRFVKPRTH
jgi:hypothetical protein